MTSIEITKSQYKFFIQNEVKIKRLYRILNKRRNNNLSIEIPNSVNVAENDFIRISFTGSGNISTLNNDDDEEEEVEEEEPAAHIVNPLANDDEQEPEANQINLQILVNDAANDQDIPAVNPIILPHIDHHPIQQISIELERIRDDFYSGIRVIISNEHPPNVAYIDFTEQEYVFEPLTLAHSIAQQFQSTFEQSQKALDTVDKYKQLKHLTCTRYYNSYLAKENLISRIKHDNQERSNASIIAELGTLFAAYLRNLEPGVDDDKIDREWSKIVKATSKGKAIHSLMSSLGLGRLGMFKLMQYSRLN